MRTLLHPSSTWVVFAAMMALAATGAGVTAANTDAGAGHWQMIALGGPTQFVVPPPAPVTGLEYQAELNAIRSA